MTASRTSIAIASVVATLVPLLAHAAENKVPGEKWKQSVSMDMAGMKMPARTFEVCVPVGKADEALARPPDNQNCQVSNVQRSGKTFAADIKCTGTPPVQGHIESTTEGNRTIGKMQMNMEGMAMTMTFDSTKLGTSCEAVDYSAAAAKAQASLPAAPDVCAQYADRIAKDPRDLLAAATLYADKNGHCATHASKKNFCSAVQTTGGFLSLSNQERMLSRAGTAVARDASTAPLTTSLQSCSLGSADALRTRLLGTAEKQNDWDFLVAEGNDATWQMLTATAKRECAGRSFTNAPQNRYSGLCRKYGSALARGDREDALASAGVMGGGSSSGASGSATPVATTSSSATATETAAAGQPAGAEPAADETQKSKARDALDKGRKKLKGLFGGGGD